MSFLDGGLGLLWFGGLLVAESIGWLDWVLEERHQFSFSYFYNVLVDNKINFTTLGNIINFIEIMKFKDRFKHKISTITKKGPTYLFEQSIKAR